LGIGICAVVIWLARFRLPDYATILIMANIFIAFVMVVMIAGISNYVGMRKVLRIEPIDIFRS
jgi:putative ABC transport system permease protein